MLKRTNFKTGIMMLMFLLLVVAAQAIQIGITGSPVKSVTATTARIEWNTDVDATSRVDYGTSPDLGLSVDVADFTRFHSITLDGLETGVKYYFQITSIAVSGEYKVANNNGAFYQFTTNGGADSTPPAFTNIRATSFSPTSTTFQWVTSEPATTDAYFGQQQPYTPMNDPTRVVDHVITLPTEAGKLYTLIVGGCDMNGNCANATSIRFLAGEQSGTPPLTTDLGQYVRENRVTINGFTRPFSTIDVFVNTFKQRTVVAAGNGSFTIPNVVLTKPTENDVKLVVTDAVGNTVEQSYHLTLDNIPPKVTLTGITPIASATPLTISGTVSEPVTITYEVQQAFDTMAPSRVLGLKTTSVKANTVALAWTENSEADVHEYGIYRNGLRIATSQKATYEDSVSSGVAYVYRISAIDKSCNEGQLSDSVSVQTPTGGTQFSGDPTEAPITCNPQRQTLQANGPFSFAANLQNGDNQIRITISDAAGNKVTFTNSTRLDNQPPQFLEDNLDKLSPTYIPEVTVKGRVSEKATVKVYLNGKFFDYVVTDDDGAFSMKVPLERFVSLDNKTAGVTAPPGTGQVVLEAGKGQTPNVIKLEAIDFAGLKATKQATIVYALCGEGSWFKVDVGQISPAVITPRLVVEGVQQLGFPVNISYRGAGKAVIRRITVTPLTLSLSQRDDYDNDWIQINPIFPVKSTAGYVQLVFQPQGVERGQTTSKKEDEIAAHRKGECYPGAGCVKFFLQLEIDAQEEMPKRYQDVRTDLTTGNVTITPITEKVCMPITTQIDVPMHLGDKIPKNFLRQTSAFLGNAMDVIDLLLKPLTTIGTYTLYGCFAMTGWLFYKEISQTFACDVASISGGVNSQFKMEYAETGLCDKAYSQDSDSSKKSACKKCQSAIESKLSTQDTMQTVCDRVACPSAPSLQTYIGDKQKQGVRPTGLTEENGNQIFAGSSCGFNGKEVVTPQSGTEGVTYNAQTGDFTYPEGGTTQTTNVGANNAFYTKLANFQLPVKSQPVGYGYESIRDQYLAYQTHKNDKAAKGTLSPLTVNQQVNAPTNKVNCAGLHPANQECCGYEYYNEWDSACGIPGIVETYDELEQSACLAAQSAGQVKQFQEAATQAKGSPVECNSLLNSVAGFCQPGTGNPVSEFLPTGIFYGGSPTQGVAGTPTEMYVEVRPVPPQDPKSYEIYRGFVFKQYQAQNPPPNAPQNPSAARDLSASEKFYQDKDLTAVFKDVALQPDGTPKPINPEEYRPFATALCEGVADPSCVSKAKPLFQNIRGKIGVPQRTYIVQPVDEGILRAAQCVCLPAVTSYLTFWHNVLGAVKTCVDHTLLTGEGSTGVCKAVLSQYVCDMLYDLLRCFVQKYSSPGAGGRASGGGIGDIIGALTKSGSRMQQDVQGRYGNTALWQTMFTDRKLLHSICVFAFTGQWDLDVKGLFQQTVNSVPIQSQGLIYPADRRYVSYDPTTKPTGMTTWTYHFGVGLMAGADLNYQLTLKCSNSINCEERDGFKNNRCDCFGKQEKILPVIAPNLGTGQMKKNDILNTELFFTMQAGGSGSEVRYDTATLEWEWKDPQGVIQHGKADAKVHLTGTDAPPFCSLQLLDSPMYLCRFNIGDYAGVSFTRDPVLRNPPNNVLLKDSQGEFSATVNLFGEADPRLQGGATTSANTKFLVYELRNGLGLLVDSNKENPLKVDTTGEKEYILRTKKIEATSFSQGSTQLSPIEFFSLALPTQYTDLRGNAIDAIDPINTKIDATKFTQPGDFVAVFTPAGVQLYKAGGFRTSPFTPGPTSGDYGFWQKIAQIGGTIPIQANTLVIRGDAGNPMLKDGAEIDIVFKQGKVPTFAAGDKAAPELLIRNTGISTTQNLCTKYEKSPDHWIATFTLFDGKKPVYGGSYEPNFEQVSTDPSGARQQRTLRVDAVCNSAYTPPTGIPGSQSGFPPNFRFCSKDPTVANTQSCYCASDAEALFLLQSQLFENAYNCGPGTSNPGPYCGYTQDAGGRVCSSTVKADVPVILGINYVQESDQDPRQLTSNVLPVQGGKVTLKKGVAYMPQITAYYPTAPMLSYTHLGQDAITKLLNIGSTSSENVLELSSDNPSAQYTQYDTTGSPQETFTLKDANDVSKSTTLTVSVTVQ